MEAKSLIQSAILIIVGFCSHVSHAQDVITTRSGDVIKGIRIVQVNETQVSYRVHRHGRTYQEVHYMPKEDVFMIQYRDGVKDVFDKQPVLSQYNVGNSVSTNTRDEEKAKLLCNRAIELNRQGKFEEAFSMFNDAARYAENNAEIHFNMATAYLSYVTLRNPADRDYYYSKAESAYARAVEISPYNANYNYNFGALYFNQATKVNDQMNNLGSADSDNKRYETLKVLRDDLIKKGLPYFERAYQGLKESDIRSMPDSDLKTYKSTVWALKESYARLNRLEDAVRMKNLYTSMGW